MTEHLRAPPLAGLRLNKFSSPISGFRAPHFLLSIKEEENFVSAFCPKRAGGGGLTLAGKKVSLPFQPLPLFARPLHA